MPTGVDISGWVKTLGEKKARGLVGILRGVNKLNQEIIGEAQQLAPVGGGKYSPRDPAPGTLASSGIAKPAEIKGDHVVAEMGFNTEYAAAQHERLDFRHEQGQAKYLEAPIRRLTPLAKEFINGEMRKEIEA